MKLKTVIPALFSLIMIIGCNTGYTGDDGVHLKQYLEPESMKALLESPHAGIMVIDVRPLKAYKKGHLPGAVSVPSPEFDTWFAGNRPDEDLIVYCETGGRAQIVVKKLEEQGFTRVMNWGGYTRWKWEYETD